MTLRDRLPIDPDRAMAVFGTLSLLFRITVELIRYLHPAKRAARRASKYRGGGSARG